MAHDASATWSGFNYQGKVALFHSFYFINQRLATDQNFDLSNYRLILERHEDFEIWDSNGPISFHQVKAYNSSSLSSYTEALLELALELERYPAVTGYLHTWKSIRLPEGGLTAAVTEYIAQLISEFQTPATRAESIIAKSLTDSPKLPKPSKILKAAYKGTVGLTGDMIVDALKRLCDKKTGSVSRIKIYQYPGGASSCELSMVETLLKGEMTSQFDRGDIVVTGSQLCNAFNFTLGLLDRHIIDRHLLLQQGNPLPIPLASLREVTLKDFEDTSEEYLAFAFKDLFCKQFQSFCDEPEYCSDKSLQACISGEACNLRDILNVIS